MLIKDQQLHFLNLLINNFLNSSAKNIELQIRIIVTNPKRRGLMYLARKRVRCAAHHSLVFKDRKQMFIRTLRDYP
jgi:hypothetical protein